MAKLIFIGPQGSGKGTQAKIISKELNIPHISTGDMLRSAEGELKEKVDEVINSGKLIDDDLMLSILKERLNNPDTKKGFILDGYPRNLEQKNMLDTITQIDKTIEINISDEEALKRLSGRVNCEKCKANYNLQTAPKPKDPTKCDVCNGKLIQRDDDKPEAIKKRLITYHEETEPIIQEYKNSGIIITINGEQDINKISDDILKILK
ncbi:nucleoside monophosphate kinase [Candidatus Pacearchaeota archaeon]|nr:nucleoside monophosphate kinase [Candidatus Pacearchaeota archaeon]